MSCVADSQRRGKIARRGESEMKGKKYDEQTDIDDVIAAVNYHSSWGARGTGPCDTVEELRRSVRLLPREAPSEAVAERLC